MCNNYIYINKIITSVLWKYKFDIYIWESQQIIVNVMQSAKYTGLDYITVAEQVNFYANITFSLKCQYFQNMLKSNTDNEH